MKKHNFELQFNLSSFNGPIDLLLQLIEKDKISIIDINVIDLANQYIEFMNRAIHDVELDKLAEYLKYTTFLINLKVKAILKYATEDESEIEDEKQELISQLLEYEKFRHYADCLSLKQKERLSLIDKDPEPYGEYKKVKQEIKELDSINPYELLTLFENLVTQHNITLSQDEFEPDFFHRKISFKALSIHEIMLKIVHDFQHKDLNNNFLFECFVNVFDNDITKLNFCYFYLALLILIKYQIIKVEAKNANFNLLFYKENVSNIPNDDKD